MPRGNYSQGTLDLRHGARVRVLSGPHAGASGDITSILVERGVTYWPSSARAASDWARADSFRKVSSPREGRPERRANPGDSRS
jgi:hypothetical protein